MSSRRTFLGAAVGGGALPLLGGAAEAPRRRREIEAEIRRRAHSFAPQRYLVVDYYRIRRQLAYPLPLKSISIPAVPVPSISNYPWAIWMTWELEERVNALGYAAEWFKDDAFASAAARDVEALAAWPTWRQYEQPDLSSAHAGRVLWAAYRKWRWPRPAIREKIRAACARHAEDILPYARKHYGPVTSAKDILALPAPHTKLANIPLIGTIGAALTASVAEHPAAGELNRLVAAVFGAVLELRSGGYTEAVGYDGYILDFIADWLGVIPYATRKAILTHPRFHDHLDQSYMLSAPGAAADVAQLSDVEAREMPFHFSAQAKLLAFGPEPAALWLADRWPLARVRADALGALAARPSGSTPAAPRAGALDAHYATVLRTGWERDDVAVVASSHRSPTGHLQADNGTLVIGHRGRWIVSDPGYQQYAQGAERTFTIGPAAHNYPVIDGKAQTAKAGRRLALDAPEPGLLRTKLDLTACYAGVPAVRSVVRNIWLAGRESIVVADEIEGAQTVAYHWHGHPDAAWFARDGWMLLHLEDADLWFHSPQAALGDANIERLEGSRGQLTASVDVKPAPPVVWWIFAPGQNPPAVELAPGAREIRVGGRRFSV